MSWDGSGNFSRTNGTNSGAETWQDDAAAGTKIRADRHDTHDQDLSDGISACLTQNNESKPTAHFLPNVTSSLNLGSTSYLWQNIYYSGSILNSTTDAIIGGANDQYFLIDTNNTTTNAFFSWGKDSSTTSATELMSLDEDGLLTVGGELNVDTISSDYSIDILLDNDDTSSNEALTIYKNGATTGTATKILELTQTPELKVDDKTAFTNQGNYYHGSGDTTSGSGTATGGSGFLTSRLSGSQQRITHNLGTSNYTAIITPIGGGAGVYAQIDSKGTTTLTFSCGDDSGVVYTWDFIIIPW